MTNAYIFDSYKNKYGEAWTPVQNQIITLAKQMMDPLIAKKKAYYQQIQANRAKAAAPTVQEQNTAPNSIRNTDLYFAAKAYLYTFYQNNEYLKGERLDGYAAKIAEQIAQTPEGQAILNSQQPQQQEEPVQQEEKPQEETQGEQLANQGVFTPEEIKNVSGAIYNFLGKNTKSFEKAVNSIGNYKGSLRSVQLSLGKLLKESKNLIKDGKLNEALVKQTINELPIEITINVTLGEANTAKAFKVKKATKAAAAGTQENVQESQEQDITLIHVQEFMQYLQEAAKVEPTVEDMKQVVQNLQKIIVKNLGTQTLKLGDKQYDVVFTAGNICTAKDANNGEFSIKIQKVAQYVEEQEPEKPQKTGPTAWDKKQANRSWKLAKYDAKTNRIAARRAGSRTWRSSGKTHLK